MVVDEIECIECGRTHQSETTTWQPGEFCLFGNFFVCSLACGEAWARKHAKPGFRPGESGFDCVEPARLSTP